MHRKSTKVCLLIKLPPDSARDCISTCMAAMPTHRDKISSNCQFGKEWRSMVKAGLREFKAKALIVKNSGIAALDNCP